MPIAISHPPPAYVRPEEPISRYCVGHSMIARPGAMIFKIGDRASRFFLVTSGVVRGYLELPDGRRQVTDFFFPGDFLVLRPGATYSLTAEAITDVELLVYSVNPREGTPMTISPSMSPEVTRLFLEALRQRLSDARDKMVSLGRKTAEERLASFLISLARHTGSDNGTRIMVPMTRADIADHLGLTLETVSRMFKLLRTKGIISLPSATEIRVLDRVALESLGNGEEFTTRARSSGATAAV